MKDPYSVLREKEQDVERVRKEIQALLTVIPLLVDGQPSAANADNVMQELLVAVSRKSVNPPDKEMAELEPFLRHLRNSSQSPVPKTNRSG
jgi:hypothetical protein